MPKPHVDFSRLSPGARARLHANYASLIETLRRFLGETSSTLTPGEAVALAKELEGLEEKIVALEHAGSAEDSAAAAAALKRDLKKSQRALRRAEEELEQLRAQLMALR